MRRRGGVTAEAVVVASPRCGLGAVPPPRSSSRTRLPKQRSAQVTGRLGSSGSDVNLALPAGMDENIARMVELRWHRGSDAVPTALGRAGVRPESDGRNRKGG